MESDLIEDDFEIEEDSIEPDAPQRIQAPPQTQYAGGERLEQRRYSGGDTLDEPVTATFMRDLKGFYHLLLQTLGWRYDAAANHEWDLWGPLVFSLTLSLVLSLKSVSQRSQAFSVVFSLIWVGQAMITANTKLLGGTLSWLQALSITGYSLFPLLLAAAFSCIVQLRIVRLVVSIPLVVWAQWSAHRGLGWAGVQKSRILLAIYPVGLFYTAVGWMCVVS